MDGRVRIAALTLTFLLALSSVAWARMNPVMLGGWAGSSGAPEANMLFHWDGSSASSGSFVYTTESATVTNSGYTFSSDGAQAATVNDKLYISPVATNLNSYAGTIILTFKYNTALSAKNWNTILEVKRADNSTLLWLGRNATSSSSLSFTMAGVSNRVFSISPQWDSGDVRTIKLSWNSSASTMKMQIDSGTVITSTSASFSDYTVGEKLYIGCAVSAARVVDGPIKDVKIYSVDML